jgi:hypothetical protein
MNKRTSFASIVSGLLAVVGAMVAAPRPAAAQEVVPDGEQTAAPEENAPPPAQHAPLPQAPAPQPEGTVEAPPMPPAPASTQTSRGLAIELSTGGLSGGAIALGVGNPSIAGGVSVDYAYTKLGTSDQAASNSVSLKQSTLAVGPWIRCELLRGLDGRVALYGAFDVQYARRHLGQEFGPYTTALDATASGAMLRAGPGIHYWATPWLALGYTAQLYINYLSGPLQALNMVGGYGPPTEDYDSLEVGLAGRFTALALF